VARAVQAGSSADTAVFAGCVLLALFATVLPSSVRGNLAGGLRRTVVSPLIAIQTQAERARAALISQDISSERRDSLAIQVARLSETEEENVRLRRLLGLGRALRAGFVPAQALHVTTLGDENDENSVLLTAGSSAGVRRRDAVVAPDGLVGVVTAVDPRTSQAILWMHPDFRVSATAGSSAFGIVFAHLGDDPERYLLELRGVAARENVPIGTVVRSSGIGGVFPRGIPIGTVIAEMKGTESWSRTYLVRPAVRPQDVTSVMILLAGGAESKDVLSAWPPPPAADSAIRRVITAADSMAREQARADSLRRAAASPHDTVTRTP
jgi:rod shape-determining protein MreC